MELVFRATSGALWSGPPSTYWKIWYHIHVSFVLVVTSYTKQFLGGSATGPTNHFFFDAPQGSPALSVFNIFTLHSSEAVPDDSMLRAVGPQNSTGVTQEPEPHGI